MNGYIYTTNKKFDKYYFANQKYLACYNKLWPLTNLCPYQLAHVKNGDEQFWKEKFHATNGKAQHALMMGLIIFFLKTKVERDL
jgi:hypothetical protein